MSLVLDEFYKNLRVSSLCIVYMNSDYVSVTIQTVSVSGLTGMGMKEFFAAIDQARLEYIK